MKTSRSEKPAIPKDLVPQQPQPGEAIEVIIRYRGQEYVATRGTVESIDIQNEITELPYGPDLTRRWESTGRASLTITVRKSTERLLHD